MGILVTNVYTDKVYKNVYIHLLEVCFLLNFSATVQYLKGKGSNTGVWKTVTASISVSFIMFLGILAYHAYLN